MKISGLLIIGLLHSFWGNSQMVIDNNAPFNTATGAINVLLGSGVTASNFTFAGDPLQLGYFNGTATNLGLDSGIVMSTGDVNALVPGNFGSFFTNTISSPDLLTVANSVSNLLDGPPALVPDNNIFSVSSINDVAKLEFDFVPASDTVQFRFVFGSSEYPAFGSGGYIYSNFNDAFGFFVDGPGIAGPYQNGAINIATVPNFTPTLPITISTIHPGTPNDFFSPIQPFNEQYYVDNSNQTTINDINGFTTVITATVAVTPCETYHMRLVIGDGTDASFNSVVFIEANSFTSEGVTMNTSTSYPPGVGGDTTLFEGCGSIDFEFERFTNLADTFSINYIVSGTAVNGFDYTQLPDSIVFLPNQTSSIISLDAFVDGISEGIETLIFEIDGSVCGAGNNVYTIYINDPYDVTTATADDTLNYLVECAKAINVDVLTGLPGFSYLWSTGDTTAEIIVSPIVNTRYIVTVTDTCNASFAIDTVMLTVIREPILAILNDTSVNCPGDPVTLNLEVSGGNPPYDITWDNGATNTLSQSLSAGITTTFLITVTDRCTVDTTIANATIFVPTPPPLTPVVSTDTITINCPGEPVATVAGITGGFGQYQYTWDSWTSQTKNLLVRPDSTTTYYFEVTDYCQFTTITIPFTVVVKEYDSLKIVMEFDTFICINEVTQVIAHVTGGATPYIYDWSNFGGSDSAVTTVVDKSIFYQVDIIDQCNNTASDTSATYIKMPIAGFDFNYSVQNLVDFTNTSSEDVIINTWNFGDGPVIIDDKKHTYAFAEEVPQPVLLTVENQYGCTNSISAVLIPPFQLFVPNGFTPNGDNKNEVFLPKGIGFFDGSYSLQIFDRWGKLVFTTTDPKEPWDGKGFEAGVYVYKIKVRGYDEFGYPTPKTSTGTITLAR